MADTSGIFKGASAYSSDFSQVVERAVNIAGLPIRQLTAQKTELTDQKTQMQAVQTSFTALQDAVDGIAQALDGSSFLTSVDDASVAAAHVSPGVVEGNYSLRVEDVGAYASSLTSSAWVAAGGQAHTYELTLGTSSYFLTPADNSAAGVAAAINMRYGDKVRASVMNVGSSSAPDYRISLQSVKLGNTPVNLKDGGQSLQTVQTVGRLAAYEVNSSGKTVTSDTRTVLIATGLSITMLASSNTPANITVTRSTSALSEALTAFADAYNAAAAELDAQHGKSGGKLQGNALIQELSSALSEMGTFTAPGSPVSGLSALGLELGREGRMTFSPFVLLGADMLNSNGVTSFLGSKSSGGFLKMASDRLNALEDSNSGSLTTALTGLDQRIAGTDETIAAKQEAVDRLQEHLLQQMTAADALIATMEQQYSYLSSMFQAMTAANQSYQ